MKKQIKDAEAALDDAAYAKYPELTEDEVKTLVVDDKWLARLDADVHGEMDRISQSLTQRVKELAERYETPLPQLSDRVADLEEKGERPSGTHGVRRRPNRNWRRLERDCQLLSMFRSATSKQKSASFQMIGTCDSRSARFGRCALASIRYGILSQSANFRVVAA